MDLSDWFKGFEKGIARLSSEQRAAFFSECSKNCVDGGVLSIYRKLYKDANGDMDVFFQMANELPGVKSEIVVESVVSIILFLKTLERIDTLCHSMHCRTWKERIYTYYYFIPANMQQVKRT